MPISKAILNSNRLIRDDSLIKCGLTLSWKPLKKEGSRRYMPRLVRPSTRPIIFNGLNASLNTLRATPSSEASWISLGIESPIL